MGGLTTAEEWVGLQKDTGETALQRTRPTSAHTQGILQKEERWTPTGLRRVDKAGGM